MRRARVFFTFVAMGALDSAPSWMLADKGTEFNVLKVLGLLDGATCIVSGMFFLQGANWARWLYTIESSLSAVLKLIFFSDRINAQVTTIVFIIICIVILFLPKANRFFVGKSRRGWRE